MNGTNPVFTAGSSVNSTSCGQSQSQGTSGSTSGAGGEGFPTATDDAEGLGYAGCPGNVSLTWTANGPPSITSSNSAAFAEGSAGSFTVTTTGYPTASLSESGALPTGVTFTDNGDGTATLTGTPTGPNGTYSFTIDATNGFAPDAIQSFTLTVGVHRRSPRATAPPFPRAAQELSQ